MAVVREFAGFVGGLGPANFIYSDGEMMIAHGNRRTHPDGIHPPGLYYLSRRCQAQAPPAARGLDIRTDLTEQDIVLIASVPLTDEDWMPLHEGGLLLIRDGCIAGHPSNTSGAIS